MHNPGQPAISIVLPVYNGEKYLENCLQSIDRQAFGDYELLIGDDGSTDETPQIIRRHADTRWQYIRHEQNLGLFGNLNYLIASTRAPLIRFLCQDDILETNCLAEEVTFFAEHPDVGMFFNKYHVIDEKEVVVGRSPIDDLPIVMPPHVSLQYYYYYGCLPGNLSTACISRKALEQLGAFDESYQVAGDFEMWVRICKQFNMGVLHKYLVKLRNHTHQLSRSHKSFLAYTLETRRIRSAMLSELPAEIRGAASHYTLMRQNVFDTHYALRCLVEGRRGDAATIAHAMGAHDLAVGLVFWLASANNRLFHPTPKFTADVLRF